MGENKSINCVNYYALESVCVNYYASASRSCQSKHDIVLRMIQPYLDGLQDWFSLKRISVSDLGDTGGSFSTNKKDNITKWWFAFWESQPAFWFSCKKSNGESYSLGTLERYMGSLKNQIVKKLVMSRYLKIIEEAYNSANTAMKKAMVKEQKKVSPAYHQRTRSIPLEISPLSSNAASG